MQRLSPSDREDLHLWLQVASTREAKRVKLILLLGSGASAKTVHEKYSRGYVLRWMRRYDKEGVRGLFHRRHTAARLPLRSRRMRIMEIRYPDMYERTDRPPTKLPRRWKRPSVRTTAKLAGVSPSTVQRLGAAFFGKGDDLIALLVCRRLRVAVFRTRHSRAPRHYRGFQALGGLDQLPLAPADNTASQLMSKLALGLIPHHRPVARALNPDLLKIVATTRLAPYRQGVSFETLLRSVRLWRIVVSEVWFESAIRHTDGKLADLVYHVRSLIGDAEKAEEPRMWCLYGYPHELPHERA